MNSMSVSPNDKVNKLVKDIEKLRQMLSPDGDYAICMKDGKQLGMGDAILMGNVLEAIDKDLGNMSGVPQVER